MSSSSVAVRLARREVRRRPGRTALVALLVALPVAGMTAAAVLIREDHRSRSAEWQEYAGHADAREYQSWDDAGNPLESTVRLPEGSRTVDLTTTYVAVRTKDRSHRSASAVVSAQPLGDPMTEGLQGLIAGRSPEGAEEIALSRAAAHDLHAAIGDHLDLAEPLSRVTVVGITEADECLSCRVVMYAPDSMPARLVEQRPQVLRLIDLPDGLTPTQLEALREQNVELRSDFLRSVSDDGADSGVRWSLVLGAVVLTVMGIVISAAFAVGARRQLVTLGQLSASGASAALLRTTLLLQGTVTGVLGSLTGAALGIGAVFGFRGLIETRVDHRIHHLPVRPLDVGLAVAVGVVAATLAALVPARTAARLPTLSALAGRRPQSAVPRRLVASGALLVVVGLALQGLAVLGNASRRSDDVWALVAIVGGVGELLGACAIAPALVARLEPLAGRVRGPWRLGARSLARSRTRTGAVVSAVAAAGALAVLATSLVTGADARDQDYLDLPSNTLVLSRTSNATLPDESQVSTQTRAEPEVRADIERILPDATRTTLRTARLPLGTPNLTTQRGATMATVPSDTTMDTIPPGTPPAWFIEVPQTHDSYADFSTDRLVIADPAVVRTAGLGSTARRKLDDLGVVILQPDGASDTELRSPDGSTQPAGIVAAKHSVAAAPADVLITEALAKSLGLEIVADTDLYTNPRALTTHQQDAIDDVRLDDLDQHPGGVDSYLNTSIYLPGSGISPFAIQLILAGVALAFALFVIGASLALAAAESKDERDVLTAAGAAPSVLARAAGSKAVLLAGIGGLMAVPIGFLPVLVYAQSESDGFPVIFPTTIVVLLVLGVPTVVGLAAMASSATAQRLRPVRVSTSVFD